MKWNKFSRMESGSARVLSYKDLELYTNEFSEENFIGRFQFGRVYRGKIPQGVSGTEAQEVTVKIWEDPEIYNVFHPEENVERLMEEVYLLKHLTIESHPHVVKLIGYCCEGEKLGAVYDLKSLDTVHNLLLKDDFTWLNRIKVALEFACLLEYFHAPREPYLPYLVRNVDAEHIMLDKDYNAKLFDFGMISGRGIFPDRSAPLQLRIWGTYGYMDPAIRITGRFSMKNNVFAFGIILLGLISRRVFDREKARQNIDVPLLNKWAQSEYIPKKSIIGFRQSKCSLVHENLEAGPGFYSSDGPKITKLAMQCVTDYPHKRPTMKQVVEELLDLRVVRHHAESLGIRRLVRGFDPKLHKASILEVVQQLICNK